MASLPTAAHPRTMSPALSPTTAQHVSPLKKVKRKTSKPIFNWIQRKLATTRKSGPVPPLPDRSVPNSPQYQTGQEMGTITSTRGRIPSALQVLTPRQLDDDPVGIVHNDSRPNSRNTSRTSSSPGPGSTWSPSNPREADDDASIRPLPPTSPPSPAPSRSSASFLSDPRTFRSAAASTKPTTLLSIDSGHGYYAGGGGAMAHIAQAPASQTAAVPAISRSPTSSLPRPSTSRSTPFQAPLHTTHHPRNNPHPASPPPDNASILTLASSAFASPGRVDWNDSASASVSYHHYRDVSSSHLDIDEVVEEDGEGDAQASMRALRPRSSRRESWESSESRWSARVPAAGGSLAGDSLVARSTSVNKPRSGLAVETTYDDSGDESTRESKVTKSSGLGISLFDGNPQDLQPSMDEDVQTPPANQTLSSLTSDHIAPESRPSITILPCVPEIETTPADVFASRPTSDTNGSASKTAVHSRVASDHSSLLPVI